MNRNRTILMGISEGSSPEKIIADMLSSFSDGADVFGFELSRVDNKYKNKETYRRILSNSGSKPVYVTNYRGLTNKGKTDDRLLEELVEIIGCGASVVDIMADLYDEQPMGFSFSPEAARRQTLAAGRIHDAGGEVLFSAHTGKFLPCGKVLDMAKAEVDRGADIVKIVTMSDSYDELLENLKTGVELKRQIDKPILFLSCGEYSRIHRLVGYMFGCDIMLGLHDYSNECTVFQPTLKNCMAMLSNNCWQPGRQS